MAKKKKKTSRKKKSSSRRSQRSAPINAAGKHLVIVESPAKARTINQYLGRDFVVAASVGHIRDLPSKAPKGSKQPVPGVDVENHFEPTYEILPDKKKVVTELKKAARQAEDVWFATDLDREGEAIAWHLAKVLDVDPAIAKRVVFNAITRSEIERAFEHPHQIDEYKVNAQQARRILDRIVGYQVSPLLWKKVARGLSAGRVQSVAVRLVVEREREIRAFVPDEYWKVTARLSIDADAAADLAVQWRKFVAEHTDERDRGPTLRKQNAWLSEHHALKAELVELAGEKFELGSPSDQPQDVSRDVERVAEAVGMKDVRVTSEEDPKGKGPARWRRSVSGTVDTAARYAVKSIETRRTSSKPPAPFITSTMQMAASSALSMSANRAMRVAQQLYEGVDVKGRGQLGLITYMRTDSTHLSGEAIKSARAFIDDRFGGTYLPEKPNRYASSKAAQEAHEAIRPTDVNTTPQELEGKIDDAQLKLYRLIWNRFVACQMTPAQWNTTTLLLQRSDRDTGAVLKATGRVLAFDGFYRVAGVPTASDDQVLPELDEGHEMAPLDIAPEQLFTSPPPRYTEASLVKKLEAEGIGRPSTYASIINVIQDRNYVEQIDRRFYATDLGEVVTDKLMQSFPRLMDIGYTRTMEEHLDKIEEAHTDWVSMLEQFYERFSAQLEDAHETMRHAKAEMQPAPYKCPRCGSTTAYRFGKNGRFLSCTAYPDCDYAAPINRHGEPLLPERVNIRCPEDGSEMVLRSGRFGKFIASVNYPDTKYVLNLDKQGRIKLPQPPPLETDLTCEKCGSPMYLRRGKRGPWLGCSAFPKCRGRMAWTKLEDEKKKQLEMKLEQHERDNPQPTLYTLDGRVIDEGTKIEDLLLPGGVQELERHPDASAPQTEAA